MPSSHALLPCVVGGEGPKSREPPTDTVVARTYSYEDEAQCDHRMATFIKSIEAARAGDGRGFAAIKMTALGPPRLLERASAALLAIRGLFRELDTNGDGWLNPGEFHDQYAKLFTDDARERMDKVGPGTMQTLGLMHPLWLPYSHQLSAAAAAAATAQVFAYLDTDNDGKVDYLTFASRVSVRDGAAIAARCRQPGPFSRAVLTGEELHLLDSMLGRVHTLAAAAADAGGTPVRM